MINHSYQVTPGNLASSLTESSLEAGIPTPTQGGRTLQWEQRPSKLAFDALSAEEYLNKKQLKEFTGFCNSKIHYLGYPKSPYYDPTWPLPCRYGKRSCRWKKSEILAWMASQSGG